MDLHRLELIVEIQDQQIAAQRVALVVLAHELTEAHTVAVRVGTRDDKEPAHDDDTSVE